MDNKTTIFLLVVALMTVCAGMIYFLHEETPLTGPVAKFEQVLIPKDTSYSKYAFKDAFAIPELLQAELKADLSIDEYLKQYLAFMRSLSGEPKSDEKTQMSSWLIRGLPEEKSQKARQHLELDPNGDGVLKEEEMIMLASAAFSTLDTDANARLSIYEYILFRKAHIQKEIGDITPESCKFESLNLPKDTLIFSAGAYSAVTQVIEGQYMDLDVYVSQNDHPVALLLGTYERTNYKFHVSPGTKVVAVVIGGSELPRLEGLDPAIPVSLNAQDDGPCDFFWFQDSRLQQVNPLSRKIFGHPADKFFPLMEGYVNIGEGPFEKSTRIIKNSPESQSEHKSSTNLPDQEAAQISPEKKKAKLEALRLERIPKLKEAVKNGWIRFAEKEDRQNWRQKVAGHQRENNLRDLPPTKGEDSFRAQVPEVQGTAFVVLQPFTLPEDLTGTNAASFIIPEGQALPSGERRFSNIYDMNTFECYGHQPGCDKKTKSDRAKELIIPSECEFENVSFPDDMVVYATGSYKGKQLGFAIDKESNSSAGLINVTVNEPQKPVALLLGAYDPTIWNIKTTPGTRIVAILAGGYYQQIVHGIPTVGQRLDGYRESLDLNGFKERDIEKAKAEKIPTLVSTYINKGPCGSFYFQTEKLEKANPISRKAFGRNATMFFPVDRQTASVVLGDDIVPESAEDKKTEPQFSILAKERNKELGQTEDSPLDIYFMPGIPLAGETGLQFAMAHGVIRKATQEDLERWKRKYIEYAKTNKTLDLPPTHGGDSFEKHVPEIEDIDKTYVVLKRDFIYPPGLYGGNSVTFMVTEGNPMPAGDQGHSRTYDFNTMTCWGPDPRCILPQEEDVRYKLENPE